MGNEISENNYLNCVARCILFDQEKKMPTSEKENDKCLPALLADGCNDRRSLRLCRAYACACVCASVSLCVQATKEKKKRVKTRKKSMYEE